MCPTSGQVYPKVAPGKTGEEAVDTWRPGDLGAEQAMHMEIGSQGRPGAAHTKASFSPFASLQSDPQSSCFVTLL